MAWLPEDEEDGPQPKARGGETTGEAGVSGAALPGEVPVERPEPAFGLLRPLGAADIVLDCDARFVSNRAACRAQPPAQVDILHVQEHRRVEAADAAEGITPHHERRAANPVDRLRRAPERELKRREEPPDPGQPGEQEEVAKNGPQRGLEPGRGRPEVPGPVVDPGSHCGDRRIRLDRGDEAGCHATASRASGFTKNSRSAPEASTARLQAPPKPRFRGLTSSSRMGRVAPRNVRRTVG